MTVTFPVKTFGLSLFIAPVIALAACSGQTPETQTSQTQTTQTQSAAAKPVSPLPMGQLTISEGYVVPPFPGRDVAAGFFELSNAGGDDRLTAASSPDSRAIEIHTHIEDNGVMRMRPIDGVDIGSEQTVKFEQGGYHLMMFGVNLKAGQDRIDVTLSFANSEAMTLTLPVRNHSNSEQTNGSATTYGSGDGASQGSDSKGSDTKGSDTKGSGTKGSGH